MLAMEVTSQQRLSRRDPAEAGIDLWFQAVRKVWRVLRQRLGQTRGLRLETHSGPGQLYIIWYRFYIFQQLLLSYWPKVGPIKIQVLKKKKKYKCWKCMQWTSSQDVYNVRRTVLIFRGLVTKIVVRLENTLACGHYTWFENIHC